MKLVCGSDHAGLRLKEELKKHLEEKGITVNDVGTHSNESVDYPDFAHRMAKGILEGKWERGILVCGSMIYGLGWTNWMRLGVWLAIGLLFYFAYGVKHSKLAAKG